LGTLGDSDFFKNLLKDKKDPEDEGEEKEEE